MKKTFILLATGSWLLAGCQNEQNAHREKTEGVHSTEQEHHHDKQEAHETEKKLHLDNGNKWKANQETTEGIRKMQQKVNNFIDKKPGAGEEDLQLLAADLKTDFNEIIKKCTMQGEPHDQLHLYLMPLLDQINGFEKASKTIKDIPELKGYLKEYFQYFE